MHVYLLDADTVSNERLAALEETLPPFRREAAARCRRPEAHRASVLGFCLVRYAVKAVSPEADTENWAYNGCGKPHLDASGALHFNLSHSGRLIAVAVSENEVGIDVEQIAPHAAGFAMRYFSEDEQKQVLEASDKASEPTRIWSAKEARVKWYGNGLSGTLLRDIPTNGVKNTLISHQDERYWLSTCPVDEIDLTWVNADELY